jgi:hypothetical protein
MGDAFSWSASRLKADQNMEDYHFGDFFTVSEMDILSYVEQHGFGSYYVFDVETEPERVVDDCFVIQPEHTGYGVWCVERGQRRLEGRFRTKLQGQGWIVRWLVDKAIAVVTAPYRSKYFANMDGPTPKRGERWPDGIIRY